MARPRAVFLVWKKFQRRAESLAAELGLAVRYYHLSWEERGAAFKALSYLVRLVQTSFDLLRWRPKAVVLQLPPSPALYPVLVYSWLTRRPYVLDCHNAMVATTKWTRWPLVRHAFRRADAVVVHNEAMRQAAAALSPRAMVIRDLPRLEGFGASSAEACARFGLKPGAYALVPGTFAADEPLQEMVDAARRLPQVPFVCTWFKERLPAALREGLPDNLVLTGYLKTEEFNGLFSNAGAAVVLTTREGTQTSGSIEAMSLGVPLVTSDLQTSRRLLGDAPVYVRNDADAIAAGVRAALADQPALRAGMRALGRRYRDEVLAEIDALRPVTGAPPRRA